MKSSQGSCQKVNRGGTEDASRAWLFGRCAVGCAAVFFYTEVIDDIDEKGARFLASTPLEQVCGKYEIRSGDW